MTFACPRHSEHSNYLTHIGTVFRIFVKALAKWTHYAHPSSANVQDFWVKIKRPLLKIIGTIYRCIVKTLRRRAKQIKAAKCCAFMCSWPFLLILLVTRLPKIKQKKNLTLCGNLARFAIWNPLMSILWLLGSDWHLWQPNTSALPARKMRRMSSSSENERWVQSTDDVTLTVYYACAHTVQSPFQSGKSANVQK